MKKLNTYNFEFTIKIQQLWVFVMLCLAGSCTPPPEPKKYSIGFSQCCDDSWRDVMNSEMVRELAFHPEIKLETSVSYSDSKKQIEQIRALTKKGIDLLIVSPNEVKPLTPIIEEIYKQGIPVILIDRKTDSDLYTAYVGADNYEIGKTAGKYIASQFSKQGKIIEIQLKRTISPSTERNQGFREAISTAPHLEVVGVLESKDNLEDDANGFSMLLKEHPEANIVFGHTDLLAETAHKMAEDQGRAKDLFFVGIDGIPGTGRGIQAVEDGILNASLLYPTGGVEVIQLASKILHHLPYEKQNTLETIVINKDNARILHNQMKQVNSLQKSIDKQLTVLDNLQGIYRDQRTYITILLFILLLAVLLGAILFYLLQEKKSSNKKLAEQNQAILEQKNEIEKVSLIAKQATEDKLRFYSYVSHEFRTPLSLILTPTEDLLRQKSIDAKETRTALQFIFKNANRLLRLVDQLLEWRKIDMGKMTLEAQTYDLVAFVKDIVYDFKGKAKNQKIDLQFICPFDTLLFWFDAEKLDKVLFNILSNAFKYTPQGGLIHVTLLKNVEKIDLIISDNGLGMNEEEKEHAFDLFYKGKQSLVLGSGLGLALSHEFVNLHQGKIQLASEQGKGTTFRITLPYLPVGASVLHPSAGVEQTHFIHPTEEPEDNPTTVLNTPLQHFENTLVLIEDNEDLNLYLKQKFQKKYNVVTAQTAEEGWDLILEQIPDVVISDVMLPKSDGFALTQKVKMDFRTSHIPVILLTAKGRISSQIEGTKAGADVYMTKPFNQELLEEKIKTLIENRDKMQRRFSGEITNPHQIPQGERKFLIEFELLIEKHIKDSTLSVAKLSQELGMSQVQLFRKISALTNKNVTDYIAEMKLRKAKKLLKETEKIIAEIAYETGFSNPSYFTTFFKQKTNQTPSEWRQQ